MQSVFPSIHTSSECRTAELSLSVDKLYSSTGLAGSHNVRSSPPCESTCLPIGYCVSDSNKVRQYKARLYEFRMRSTLESIGMCCLDTCSVYTSASTRIPCIIEYDPEAKRYSFWIFLHYGLLLVHFRRSANCIDCSSLLNG